MRRASVTAVAVALALAGASAQAFFQYRGGAGTSGANVPDLPAPPVCAGPGLVASGSPAALRVRGYGRDVPLKAALAAMAPTGWTVSVEPSPGAAPGGVVSWGGDEEWAAILRRLAEEAQVCVAADWARRTVRVEKVRYLGNETSIVMGERGSPELQAPLPEWKVEAGETLRATLQRWSAQTRDGWHVIWEPHDDLEMVAPAVFRGAFVDVVGSLMEAVQAGGAPYGAEIYRGNRVIRVLRVR